MATAIATGAASASSSETTKIRNSHLRNEALVEGACIGQLAFGGVLVGAGLDVFLTRRNMLEGLHIETFADDRKLLWLNIADNIHENRLTLVDYGDADAFDGPGIFRF